MIKKINLKSCRVYFKFKNTNRKEANLLNLCMKLKIMEIKVKFIKTKTIFHKNNNQMKTM